MKHSRNSNYETNKPDNREDTLHIIPSTLRLLGMHNYYDMPGVFTI